MLAAVELALVPLPFGSVPLFFILLFAVVVEMLLFDVDVVDPLTEPLLAAVVVVVDCCPPAVTLPPPFVVVVVVEWPFSAVEWPFVLVKLAAALLLLLLDVPFVPVLPPVRLFADDDFGPVVVDTADVTCCEPGRLELVVFDLKLMEKN